MQISKVERIVDFIKFLNEGHAVEPFEYQMEDNGPQDYKLIINVTTTAFVNEANALAMVIDGCTYLCVSLKYDKSKGVIWELK